jgi:hypothetical protein
MTFRARILLACLFVALLPLFVLIGGARREVRARLTAGFEARVVASTAVIRQDLSRQADGIDGRLRALADRIADDPLRRAALLRHTDSASLIDYAPAVMPVAGLDYLLLLAADGRVLSSGHFRGDFDRELASPQAFERTAGPVLVAARRAHGPFVALARAVPFTLAGQRFALIGGIEVDDGFLHAIARDTADLLTVSLTWPGGVLSRHS